MMPIMLAPFDPSRDFEARTHFRAGGHIFRRDQPFDKSVVNTRVLRQLYEGRKIAYAPPAPAAPGGKKSGLARLLKGFRQAVGSVVSQNIEGASGSAREAPSAAESTVAQSSEASAPQTGEASPETVSPNPTPEAAASNHAPPEGEAATAPVGDAETAAAARQHKIDQLVIDHSQKQLLGKAEGLDGVGPKTTKVELAAALVDAGLAA